MREYLSRFFKLKCCGDVLNVVIPISSGVEKEISEAFAIVNKIKPLALKDKNKYNIVDFCAGNPVGSVISAFLLPVKKVTAVDKRKVKRRYEKVKKFKYIEKDIFDKNISKLINKNTIIMAIHPCGELSKRIIEIYKKSKARYLFLMPCCEGHFKICNKTFLQDNLAKGGYPTGKTTGNYLTWVYYLSTLCKGNIVIDKKCLSPRNAIIIAKK